MNRVKELREEQGLSIEELAKMLGMNIKEYSEKEKTGFYPDELERIAIRLGVPKSYLGGRTNYLSKGEREYRNKLKQVAKSELDYIERDFVPGDQFADWYAPSLSAAAQLCIAANLIRLTEDIEELSDKVGELNDTIYSYGMFVSSQP